MSIRVNKMCIEEAIMTMINYLNEYNFSGTILYASTRKSSRLGDFLIENDKHGGLLILGLVFNHPELCKEYKILNLTDYEYDLCDVGEFKKHYTIIYKN